MIRDDVVRKANSVKKASRVLSTLAEGRKNDLLKSIARLLKDGTPAILAANEKDVREARRNGLS